MVSRCMPSTQVKSFRTRMPNEPILRRRPPCAPWAICFLGVPDSNAAGEAVVISSTLGRRSMALRISVLADDGGAMRPSQTGGPGRWLAAIAPRVT